MSNVSLINYSTREFTTKGEMDSYIRKQDEIFTEEVTKIFIEAGMLRRVVTQIWNKKETFRVGIIFEYKDQTAYDNYRSGIDGIINGDDTKYSNQTVEVLEQKEVSWP